MACRNLRHIHRTPAPSSSSGERPGLASHPKWSSSLEQRQQRGNAARSGCRGAGSGLGRLPGVHEWQGGGLLVSTPAAPGPGRHTVPTPFSQLLMAACVACRRVERCGWRQAPPQQQRPQPVKRGARLQAATSPPFFERQGGSSSGVPGGGAGAAAVEAAGGAALAVPPATPAAERIGVLLLNLGGPDSLDDVQPFLYNLFADPDIIRLPSSVQFLQPAIAQLISTVSTGWCADLRTVGTAAACSHCMQGTQPCRRRRRRRRASSCPTGQLPPACPPAGACTQVARGLRGHWRRLPAAAHHRGAGRGAASSAGAEGRGCPHLRGDAVLVPLHRCAQRTLGLAGSWERMEPQQPDAAPSMGCSRWDCSVHSAILQLASCAFAALRWLAR